MQNKKTKRIQQNKVLLTLSVSKGQITRFHNNIFDNSIADFFWKLQTLS